MAGDLDYNRLCSAMHVSRKGMQVFREEFLKVERHKAGNRYSNNAASKTTYLNLVNLYSNIVGRQLISKNPRVLLTTLDRSAEPTVAAMQAWVNPELERMNLANTLQRIVGDSLSAIGISMIGLATPADAAMSNWNLKAGDPFVRPVQLDDWGFDINCHDLTEARFMFNRFRVPIDVVKDSKFYDPKATKNLTVSTNSRYNETGDEKIGAIGNEYRTDEEFEDMVDLVHVWVPSRKMTCILAEDEMYGASPSSDGPKVIPLRQAKWIGHDTGPYEILAHQLVSGNPFPKGPLQDVVDLHEAANEVTRKLIRQAARMKNNTFFRDKDEADRNILLNDGDIGWMIDPNGVKIVDQGGPNQGLFLFLRDLISRFSWLAGNLETLGGLSPQANTLGQEEILASQSNGQIASMQDTTLTYVSKVVRKLCWYWWHDPYKVMRSKYTVPGMPEMWTERKVLPWNHPGPGMKRNGKMPEIKIDPYSLRHATPQQRASDLEKTIATIYIPMAQIAQQQGVVLDFNEFLKIMSEYRDIPEMQRVLTMQEPPKQESASGPSGSSSAGPAPANTTREYVRRSLGGNSSNAQNAGMDSMLAAGMNGQSNGQMNGTDM